MEERWRPVREACEDNIQRGREKAMQLCVFVRGTCVVDIQGARTKKDRVDEEDHILFSSSKVFESLVIAMLVDKGLVSYGEAPIATYWPEFGTVYSPTLTAGQWMRHEGGLSVIQRPQSLIDLHEHFRTIPALQLWILYSGVLKMDEDVQCGEVHTRYYAMTRGMLTDVLVYRVTGMRTSEYIQLIVNAIKCTDSPSRVRYTIGSRTGTEKIRYEPMRSNLSVLGELVWNQLGIIPALYEPRPNAPKEAWEHYHRRFMKPEEIQVTKTMIFSSSSRARKSVSLIKDIPASSSSLANSERFRSLPLVSVTGHSNAYTLARIGSELVSGKSLF